MQLRNPLTEKYPSSFPDEYMDITDITKNITILVPTIELYHEVRGILFIENLTNEVRCLTAGCIAIKVWGAPQMYRYVEHHEYEIHSKDGVNNDESASVTTHFWFTKIDNNLSLGD